MKPELQIHPSGENAIILLVSYYNTSTCVTAVRQLQNQITELQIPGVISVRPGLDSLLLEFEDGADRKQIEKGLENLELAESTEKPSFHETMRVPVCYEPEFGIDLENVAKATRLTPEDVIQHHSFPVYKVWMIGFMPGFPYLGELSQTLQIPRKPTPDPRIPAGSVAVAEEYVGVYPFDSPGGWHVLGRTPLRLFDYRRTSPWLFQYGMQVQFYSITKEEFQIIKREEQ